MSNIPRLGQTITTHRPQSDQTSDLHYHFFRGKVVEVTSALIRYLITEKATSPEGLWVPYGRELTHAVPIEENRANANWVVKPYTWSYTIDPPFKRPIQKFWAKHKL